LSENLQIVLCALAIISAEYTVIAVSSLVSKIVIANFVRDLGELTRSRETKRECQAVEEKIVARYRQSFLWPLEIWKEYKRRK